MTLMQHWYPKLRHGLLAVCSSDLWWMVCGNARMISLPCETRMVTISMCLRCMSLFLRIWRVCLALSHHHRLHPGALPGLLHFPHVQSTASLYALCVAARIGRCCASGKLLALHSCAFLPDRRRCLACICSSLSISIQKKPALMKAASLRICI